MGKRATKLFTVYYKDGTYLSYEFTKKDYEAIQDAMLKMLPAVVTSIGVLAISDIRAVILQRKIADVPQNEGANPDLPPQAIEWLKSMNLAEKVLEEDDVDYKGGMIL